jgi:hypothetical protein
MVRLEGLGHPKTAMILIETKTETFWFIAWFLNHLIWTVNKPKLCTLYASILDSNVK